MTAGDERVAIGSGWTGADSEMSLGLADGVGAALSEAWIGASVVDASAVIAALVVRLTFASDAGCKRVSGVAWWACADGTLALCSVIAGCANGVASAWIRAAQIFRHELSAADERIASHVAGTRADGRQTAKVAVSVDTARTVARILADSIVTSWS